MAKILPGSLPNLTADHFTGIERVTMEIEVNDQFVDWWDAHLYTPYKLTPEGLASILLAGLTRDETLTYYRYADGPEGAQLSIAVEGRSGKRLIYIAGETLFLDMKADRDLPERHVEIDVLDVVPDRQGQGISAEFMSNTYELAKAIKVSKMAVEAYLSGGPYAWPRYGFVPLQKHWDEIKARMRAKLDELGGQVPADVRARLDPVLAAGNPRAIFALMDEDMPVDSAGHDGVVRSIGLARALLADTDQRWYGVLDLDDIPSETLFKGCIARNARW